MLGGHLVHSRGPRATASLVACCVDGDSFVRTSCSVIRSVLSSSARRVRPSSNSAMDLLSLRFSRAFAVMALPTIISGDISTKSSEACYSEECQSER